MSSLLDEWFASLPEATRAFDEANGFDLRRWMRLLTDQIQPVYDLHDRITYLPADEGGDGGTSDLVDPDTADVAWLPWIAQLLGVTLPATTDPVALRDAARFASSGWRSGTKQAIADAARSALTGSRYVQIVPHWAGDPWQVLVRTRASETADSAAVLAAVTSKGAKPAGVVLVHQAYSPTRAFVDANLTTRAQWDAALNPRASFEELGAPTS